MDKAELLSEFNAQLSLCEKYQSYIEKAETYAERFSAAVVEKVVADNTAKLGEAADSLGPMAEQLHAVTESLAGDKQGILDELELRLAIGEISEDEFASGSTQLKDDLGNIDSRVAEIDDELGTFSEALGRWNAFAAKGGFAQVGAAEPEVEEDVAEEIELDDDIALDDPPPAWPTTSPPSSIAATTAPRKSRKPKRPTTGCPSR